MSQVAIIPARGGSKRIPGKNVKLFNGRPIIAYAIDAAIESGLFDEVVVSTDSVEIERVARQCGAEVPFLRRSKTADDNAGMSQAVVETLERLKENGKHFDSVCCLFATGPFITSELIIAGFKKLSQSGAGSVITVQKNAHPIMRSLTLSDSGVLKMLWEEHRTTRSQDLSATYHDAAQMYWATTKEYIKQQTFYIEGAEALILGELDAHDIDTPEDWEIAEKLWNFNNFSK